MTKAEEQEPSALIGDWKLTPEEIEAELKKVHGDIPILTMVQPQDRAIATAAGKKARRETVRAVEQFADDYLTLPEGDFQHKYNMRQHCSAAGPFRYLLVKWLTSQGISRPEEDK